MAPRIKYRAYDLANMPFNNKTADHAIGSAPSSAGGCSDGAPSE